MLRCNFGKNGTGKTLADDADRRVILPRTCSRSTQSENAAIRNERDADHSFYEFDRNSSDSLLFVAAAELVNEIA